MYARPLLAALVMLVAAPVVGATARAAHSATTTITALYMSTDAAFAAYNPGHPIPPPRVGAYPLTVRYVALYFSYAGLRPQDALCNVDITRKGLLVRHGALHALHGASGRFMLDLPANGLLHAGRYQAVLHLGRRLVLSTAFSLIATPAITQGYMITTAAWSSVSASAAHAPVPVPVFFARPAAVAFYFQYRGAAGGESYQAAVYDYFGRQVHRSVEHRLPFAPGGAAALLLPSDRRRYDLGAYRTDLYIRGALVLSVPWSVSP